MPRNLALLLAFAVLSGCAPGTPSGTYVPPGDTAGTHGKDPGLTLVTETSTLEVRAGETATFFCFLSDGVARYLPDMPVTLDVLPDGGPLTVSGHSVSFRPTKTGPYHVRCAAADATMRGLTEVLLSVRAGPLTTFSVDLPDEECFSQAMALPLRYDAYDVYGNRIDEPDVKVTITPNDGVSVDAFGRYHFVNEGIYDLVVEAAGPLVTGFHPDPFFASIYVDSTAPRVSFSQPARAAMLTVADVNAPVPVVGQVSDPSGLVALSVAGSDIPTTAGQTFVSFSTTQPGRFGMSLVTARAEDTCGNIAKVTQSFLAAPSYAPGYTQAVESARVSAGARAHLSQAFVDDGDRADMDDLVTIVNKILVDYDYDAEVPPGKVLAQDPIRGGCAGYQVWDDTDYVVSRYSSASRPLSFTPGVAQVTFIDGGLSFAFGVTGISVPLSIDAGSGECSAGTYRRISTHVDAWVTASSVFVSGTLGLSVDGSGARVSLASIDFQVNGADLNLDCGDLSGVCNSIADLVLDSAVGTIEDGVEKAARQQIPEALGGLLNGFDLSQVIALPPPFHVQLGVNGAVEDLSFCGAPSNLGMPSLCYSSAASFAEVGVAAQIYPLARGPYVPGGALGPLRTPSVGQAFPAAVPIGVSVRDELLNQFLWAVWYGGGLDVPNARAIAPDVVPAGVELAVHPMLPPVFLPSTNLNGIKVGIGDLFVSGRANLNALIPNQDTAPGEAPMIVTVGLYASIIAEGIIDIDPTTNQLIVALDPQPEVGLQIVDFDGSGYEGLLSDVAAQFMEQELPGLVEKAVTHMPLPAFALSDVPGALDGAQFGITQAGLTHKNGVLMVTGNIGPLP